MLEKAMQSFFGHDEVSPVPINPWGKGLIRLLIINALIPLEILSARKRKDKEHETRIIDMFMRYPGLLENNQMRDMKRFITENQSKQLKGSALRQLGLQQLYRENCKIHDCKSCREMKDRLISNL